MAAAPHPANRSAVRDERSASIKEIKTSFWLKPIPMRGFDWNAVFDGYEPGDPIGYGATEQAAIADLLELDGE